MSKTKSKTLKKSKTKTKSKTKSKTLKKSKVNQNGGKGGKFMSEIVDNVNYKYNKSEMSDTTFSLVCKTSNCNSRKFKQRTMKIPTKSQSWWKPTYFENTTYFFTCVNCGRIEALSTDISIM